MSDIKKPATSTITTQTGIRTLSGIGFDILQDSGQYGKTRSISVDVGSSLQDFLPTDGQLLARYGEPSDQTKIAPAGYHGYLLNVIVRPENANYSTCERISSIFEIATGEDNAARLTVSGRRVSKLLSAL